MRSCWAPPVCAALQVTGMQAGHMALRHAPKTLPVLRPAGARRLTTDLKSAFVEAIPEEMARGLG